MFNIVRTQTGHVNKIYIFKRYQPHVNDAESQTGQVPQALRMQALLTIWSILPGHKLVTFHKLYIFKRC